MDLEINSPPYSFLQLIYAQPWYKQKKLAMNLNIGVYKLETLKKNNQ